MWGGASFGEVWAKGEEWARGEGRGGPGRSWKEERCKIEME